ncbi:ogr/Delta-like zinc finger family protein [Lysobacter brunescens]|uniref:Ogr/Delta-like zinc finger family protein n=1 Tax=Lysobacter brunescens TaxID=262323 RepID=A0ABW2YF31_9GAMM
MNKPAASHFRMTCPHCEAPARVRDSREQSTLVRALIFQCTNWECGHVFAALLSVERTISPSAIPKPDVVLPLSQHIRSDVLLRQLDMFPKEQP